MRQQAVPTLPALDVRETDDAYVVKAEMPGVKPDDAEVTLDGRTLVIRGKYGEERDDEREGRWIVRERRSGTYARAITLPGAIDPEKITTSFEDGELKLTLPKAEESRARRIPIQGGQTAKSVGSGEGRTTGDGNGSRSRAGEHSESRSR
jgi:HSP20 family protein